MQNFNYYNPTQVILGEGQIESIKTIIPGNSRVLVTYGRESARKSGMLSEINKLLGDRFVREFGGIEPNPEYATILKGIQYAKEERIDYLLAVGGGSVIDATKFIAAALCYDNDDYFNLLDLWGENIKSALPVGVVLTLPGSGSETNSTAVINYNASKIVLTSSVLYPKFAILDPTKTYSVPRIQLANGLADAFIHVLEQYLTYPVDAMVQDKFSESLLTTLLEIAPAIISGNPEYNSRATFMLTASLAANGLIGSGVPQDWSAHFIGHEITALYGIDHARSLPIILLPLLNNLREDKNEKLLQYAERVWNLKEGDDSSKITLCLEKTREFFELLGIKTRLSDYGIGHHEVDEITERLSKNGMTGLGEHRNITPTVVRDILLDAL